LFTDSFLVARLRRPQRSRQRWRQLLSGIRGRLHRSPRDSTASRSRRSSLTRRRFLELVHELRVRQWCWRVQRRFR